MRIERLTELDREVHLADAILRMRADNAATNHTPGCDVKEELGETLVAAVGDSAPVCRLGEHRLTDLPIGTGRTFGSPNT